MGHRDDVRAPVTLVVADDHTVLRSGLRMLLESQPDLRVVAEAGTVQGVLREVRTHRPDVLVLDLNMPGGSSVEAIGRLSRMSPRTAIVVLTMEHDPAFQREAMAAGARGYVLKEAAAEELVSTIGRIVGLPQGARPPAPRPPPD